MLLNEYIEGLKTGIYLLDDYGLAMRIESETSFREESEAFVTFKILLVDDSELYIREYLAERDGKIEKLSYSYQYQAGDKSLIFRYDNAEHKPALGFNEHKHTRAGNIIPSPLPQINEIVDEVISYL